MELSAPRHLVWDWNGTLLADLPLVIAATNTVFAGLGGPQITAEHHRRHFRRPIAEYYGQVLGRPVPAAEFADLDRAFHDAYLAGLSTCRLADDAPEALRAWPGSQSLLSMWSHDQLVPTVAGFGLTGHFVRVDGRRRPDGEGDRKAPHLTEHLAALRLTGGEVVLIGDTVDDAHAAAAVGAGCVLYSGGFTDPERLRQTGVPVAGSLLEAVAIARTTAAPVG